jgi:hypothetical protein
MEISIRVSDGMDTAPLDKMMPGAQVIYRLVRICMPAAVRAG